MSRLANLAVNLVLACASAALFAGALEVSAHLLDLKTGFFLVPTPENCLRRDRLLSLSFRPNCEGLMSETEIETNSRGHRSEELREGRGRILSIGDSCTWGWRVGQDESYPAVMQRLLNEGSARKKYDVINAGVPGFTTYQGMLYLRERGLALDPEVVVVNYGFNDPTPDGDVERQLRWQGLLLPLLQLDDVLVRRSRLWRWGRWQGEMKAQKERPPRVSLEGHKRNLASIVDLARTHGAKVVLLDLWGEYDPSPYAKALKDVAGERAVPLVLYRGPRSDLVHPTKEGYEVLAEQIVIRLAYEGYIR